MSKEKSHMDKKILFIGEFPPPYTGVTIKDSLIVDEIFTDYDVERFNLYCFKYEKIKFPVHAFRLLKAIKRARLICVGVGHPFRTCMIFRLARLMHGWDFLDNIIVFMMGIGTPAYLHKHKGFLPEISKGRCIFTESEQLNRQLNELGCSNARYLPNFRKGDRSCVPRPVGDVVKFVYFAQVRPEKGIDTLANATKELNRIGYENKFTVSIYGSIVDGFKNGFDELIAQIPNITYMGAFDSSKNDVYSELNKFDSSVSSSWREGMSGSNIECKFSGIANIVSDAGFNPECVSDGVDGILVKPGDIDSLRETMERVINDHEFLYELKKKSYESRLKYDVAAWKQKVIEVVTTVSVKS